MLRRVGGLDNMRAPRASVGFPIRRSRGDSAAHVSTTAIATWKRFNGDESVVTIDRAALVRRMEPLSKRLADEVYGAGRWDTIRGL